MFRLGRQFLPQAIVFLAQRLATGPDKAAAAMFDHRPGPGKFLHNQVGVVPLHVALGQAGQQIIQRQLQVAPTLTIRPGFPVRMIVTRDLVLEPYRG